jgi:hypothetical protein
VIRAGWWIAGSKGEEVKKQLYKKEPSKMEWIRKSKACQMKRMRREVGVDLLSTRRERM